MKSNPHSARPAPWTRLGAVGALGLLAVSACSTTPADEPRMGQPTHASTTPSTASSPTATTAAAKTTAAAGSGEDPDEGPVVPGAANVAWMKQARKTLVQSDPPSSACLDTLLDQTTLDAVATYLPQITRVGLGGLRHEAGCTFTGPGSDDGAPSVQVKRVYLANDTDHSFDELGLLGSDMCAADREQDANGISTKADDVDVFRGPGGTIRATVRAAWSCSEDGGIASVFRVAAGPDDKKGIPDPAQLAKPGFAVAAATHLHDTEVNWAPTLDDFYEQDFRDIRGQ